MFTTDPFSIRAERGMGELDPPGTYRDMGGGGGSEIRPRGGRRDCVPARPSGESGLVAPIRLLFPPLPLLFIEEKGRQKTRSGKQTFLWDEG